MPGFLEFFGLNLFRNLASVWDEADVSVFVGKHVVLTYLGNHF